MAVGCQRILQNIRHKKRRKIVEIKEKLIAKRMLDNRYKKLINVQSAEAEDLLEYFDEVAEKYMFQKNKGRTYKNSRKSAEF